MNTRTWVALGVWVIVSGWLGPVVQEGAAQESVAQEMEAVSQAERDAVLAAAVTPFLQALQSGDTQRLEQLIGGKLALTLGKLLRENTEYPEYLRQRYGGARVSAPIQMVQRREATGSEPRANEGQQRVAVVHMATATGAEDHFFLYLEQDAQGAWKVIDKTRQH